MTSHLTHQVAQTAAFKNSPSAPARPAWYQPPRWRPLGLAVAVAVVLLGSTTAHAQCSCSNQIPSGLQIDDCRQNEAGSAPINVVTAGDPTGGNAEIRHANLFAGGITVTHVCIRLDSPTGQPAQPGRVTIRMPDPNNFNLPSDVVSYQENFIINPSLSNYQVVELTVPQGMTQNFWLAVEYPTAMSGVPHQFVSPRTSGDSAIFIDWPGLGWISYDGFIDSQGTSPLNGFAPMIRALQLGPAPSACPPQYSQSCCNLVCANDPTCCTSWTASCDTLAQSLCSSPGQCANCPVGATQELEPCGADVNGGCNSNPPAFNTITCGETVCGEAWADGGTRDTDWYRINHPGGLLEWTVHADFDAAAFIIEAHCNNPAILAAAFHGCPTTVSAVLPAGDYYLFVAVDDFQSPACGSGQNNYTAEATCIPASGAPNEFCATADPISFNTPVAVDSTNAATDGPHEFSHCGFTGMQDADVWYEFTAGCDKTYTFELQAAPGSAPDRIMGLYRGGCPTQPDTVDACGDTFTGNLSISMDLVAGETVLMRVGTPGGFPAQSILTVSSSDCPFDLNDDCVVNIADLLLMLSQWGQPYQIPHLLQLLGAWGPCP